MTDKKLAERDVDDNFNINPKHKAIAALGRKMIDMSSRMTGTDDNTLMMANALSRLGESLESFGASFGPKSMSDVVKMTGMSQDVIQMLIGKAKADKDASTNRAAEPAEGNKFSGELKKAKDAGKDEFEVDGKKHKVKEDEVEESGLQYHTGVKKHGKEYMKKAAAAGRDGASQEELGRLKDKYSKAEKNKKNKTNEGLADMADMAERDHEVQMARAELYKIAKYSIKLHEILKGVSEAEGIEGWMQSKITKAADYIGSVYHTLDYDKSPIATESHKFTMDESDVVKYKDSLTKKLDEENKGLYYNVNKRKKAGTSRKKGAKGAPTAQDWKNAAKTAKESTEAKCADCGNPSYKSVSEEKKKGSHGKVCWKGYRRGKGNSCHKVKGD